MFGFVLDRLREARVAPEMSSTERAALEAGDTWLDAELFSGRPDLRRMLEEPYPHLDEREQAFLAGPVAEVCAAMDPEHLERTLEFPETVWQLLREHRFFGLGIPEEYGGHGFSALCQSTVFGVLGSRSMPLSSLVLIPNSVGPGELLVEVGTEEQKAHYLPRLARGDEIPCFALTEPTAGSDAASMTSRGEVFRDSAGEIRIRLDWDKRYITLAPIATLLGLAFKLHDPENLLGHGEEPGITCALVPTDLDGVEIGARHDPLGVPFPNGPTRGRGVVIEPSAIIGGPEYAGKGWRMLMEALSGGRAISLPAQATAGAKYVARVAGAYSMVRRQFGLPIGRFEGVSEPLGRIAGRAYLLEAMRVFTCGGLASGHRPAVISAIVKYNGTELARQSAIDGMDVLGGAAICLGPRNLVERAYRTTPIGITVEGANILTRTLIVFGQGAIRCHPHAHDLLESIRTRDVPAFRRALIGQQLHVLGNLVRGLFHGVTLGRFARSPVRGETARHYRRLAWASARFAGYSDLAMLTLGGSLKTRGRLTGRFADVLSWMYLVFAALRRFEAEGRREEDLPLVHWACDEGFWQIQQAFDGIFRNFDAPVAKWWMRTVGVWWNRAFPIGHPPTDRASREAAQAIQRPGEQRDRLTAPLHVEPGTAWADLEEAFRLSIEAEDVLARVKQAMKRGDLPKGSPEAAIRDAEAADLVTAEERALVERAAAARAEAIRVDEFTLDELRGRSTGTQNRSDDSVRDAAGG